MVAGKTGKAISVLIGALFLFQTLGCGTILYPERRGQKSGRIDVGVAVLDGIGLLLFFIPGVIAYAVDFSTGTIYLPGTHGSSLEIKDIKQVKFDLKKTGRANIEKIIKNETGYDIDQYQSKVQIVKLKSTQDMIDQFEKTFPWM